MAAKKKRRRAPQRSRRTASQGMPGWVWMLFGLAVGLAVAAAVWFNDHRPPAAAGPAPTPASAPPPAETGRAASTRSTPRSDPAPASRYDFYEMLPNQKFVVAPELSDPPASERPEIVPAAPGTYLLQAGSFRNPEDADRMKGNLALLGMQPYVQKYSEGGQTYHRVRVGPLTDLERFDEYRRLLRRERIEFMVMRAQD